VTRLRRSIAHNDPSPGGPLCLDVGVEYPGGLEGRSSDCMAAGVVARLARATVAVLLVVEISDARIDLAVMAVQTTLVRQLDSGHREGRITGEVNPHLPECHELVGEVREHAGVHVTLDACDLGMRAGLPRGVVGGHLMTGVAEGGAACVQRRGCIQTDKRDEGDARDDQAFANSRVARAGLRIRWFTQSVVQLRIVRELI